MASFNCAGRGLGMVVHPVPDRHVHQRDAGDLVSPPEIVERLLSLALRVGCGEAQQFQVVPLEYEGERLGECGVGHALQQSVVDVVEGENLLDVVAHFVDRDVEALVVHAALSDARPQVRFFATHLRAHGVARRRAPDRPRCCGPGIARVLRRSRASSAGWECLAGRPQRSDTSSRPSRRVRLRCTGCRGRKPLYQMSNGSSGRSSRASISFATFGTSGEVTTCSSMAEPVFRDLTILVKAASDECGRGRRVRIGFLGCKKCLLQHRVTRIRLAAVAQASRPLRASRSLSSVVDVTSLVNGFQSTSGLLTTTRGNRLGDDALHYLLDHSLLGQAIRRIRIVGLDFVAQVPVAEQAHLRREQTLALASPPGGASRCCIPKCIGRTRLRPARCPDSLPREFVWRSTCARRTSAHCRRDHVRPIFNPFFAAS